MTHSRQEFYLHQIRISSFVLQFDISAGRGLTIWKWPVNEAGERVTPSDLADHRSSHYFLGPCCICPAVLDTAFTESAIVLILSGRHAGQYVARCARGYCGYYVPLENAYIHIGTPLFAYLRRDAEEPRPTSLPYSQETTDIENFNRNVSVGPSGRSIRPLKRSYALSDIGNTSIPLHRKSCHNRKRKPLLQLLQLNSSVRPGLSEKDFRSLFVQCSCGLVMTKDVFRFHYCTVQETEVIEITDSDTSE